MNDRIKSLINALRRGPASLWFTILVIVSTIVSYLVPFPNPILIILNSAIIWPLLAIFLAFTPLNFKSILGIIGLIITLIVLPIAGFTMVYNQLGIVNNLTGKKTFELIECFYFSISTFVTVGFGDYIPAPESRIFAVTESVMGYLYLGVLIAYILKVMRKERRK